MLYCPYTRIIIFLSKVLGRSTRYKKVTASKFQNLDETLQADIAWAFQTAAIDTLRLKCERALQQTGLSQLVIAGGVSANLYLRQSFAAKLTAELYFPRFEFCTDNGAMIAFAGYQHLKNNQYDDLVIQAKPRWSL